MEKIVFLDWSSYGNEFIIPEFRKKGYEVIRFPFDTKIEDVRSSTLLSEMVVKKIIEESPAFVFSYNFFPVVAIACKACNICYVSWVYDSPYVLLYSETIRFDTNRVFLFDSDECKRLWQNGVQNVFYLPLASAADYYDKMIPSRQDHQKYDSDVTFIGATYSEKKQHMFRHLDDLDEYTKGYVEGLICAQKNIYGMDIIEPALHKNIIDEMVKVCPVSVHGDGFETLEWAFANYFLLRKVTANERMEILKNLSEHFQVKLFTREETPSLPQIQNMGRADYYNHAPLAMKCAKVNLNISLRSIHSGIPLRVMDILGCGGFLLSNYQSDMLEYLEPGVDFVYYEEAGQVTELADYYLRHENERKLIAENGYKKAKECFSYERLLTKMLQEI